MKRLTVLGVWVLAWGMSTIGFGANLGAWALTADGTGTSEEAAKVTVGNFVGGSGINAITYGASGGWATGWTLNPTLDATDYFEVTIAPMIGNGLVINGIDYSERRSGAGILAFQVRSSTNNFSSYTVLATETVPDNDSERTHSISGLNISVAEGQTFRVRFYGYQSQDSGGTWRINDGSLKIIGTAMNTAGPPVIGFTPGSGVQVHVSNTLDVAISLLPSGVVHEWSVDPTPVGATSYGGGVFHFTPAAADEGGPFTLTVVATNVYGTTTGTLAITVTEYLPPGSYEITFDNAGEVKTSYDVGPVSLNGQIWVLDQAIIGDTASDVKAGARAARFGKFFEATMTSSNKLLGAGLGTISFLYAQYAGGDAGAQLVVEVATDVAVGDWLEVGRVDANGVAELTKYQATIGVNQAMYVRIRTEYAAGVGQVNVDSILILPYQAPVYTAYEQYLRQYNVTPGDSGTAEGEDWDGDGAANQEEFDASPQTNPYDEAIYPPPP